MLFDNLATLLRLYNPFSLCFDIFWLLYDCFFDLFASASTPSSRNFNSLHNLEADIIFRVFYFIELFLCMLLMLTLFMLAVLSMIWLKSGPLLCSAPQSLEYLNILIILLQFFLCFLNGLHQFAMGFCLLVALSIIFNKLSEFRGTQLRTNFDYYDAYCVLSPKKKTVY